MFTEEDEQILLSGLWSIKNGIEGGDWQLVCDGYATITGEELQPPENKSEPEKSGLKLLRERLQSDDTVGGETKPKKKVAKKKKAAKKKSKEKVEALPIAADPDVEANEIVVDGGEDVNAAMRKAGDIGKRKYHKTPVSQKIGEAGTVKFITTEVDANMKERNQAVSEARGPREERSAAHKFEVKCDKCGETFKSIARESKQYGQICSKCISEDARGR